MDDAKMETKDSKIIIIVDRCPQSHPTVPQAIWNQIHEKSYEHYLCKHLFITKNISERVRFT
jgi:hypothetical protein